MCIPPLDYDSTLIHGRLDPYSEFLDEDPALRDIFKELGETLNLMTHEPPNEYEPEDEDDIPPPLDDSSVLSLDLQLHHSEDDQRLYLINFARLSPPDLPKPSTNNILTKQFRPEFIATLTAPLLSDTYRTEVATVPNITEITGHHIDVSMTLLSKLIPSVAQKLDALDTLIYDPQTFIHFYHNQGLNCRYLGLVFQACNLPHSRSLVASEVIARSVKHIVGQTMRSINRHSRAWSVVAEERKRSKAIHFRTHNFTLQEAMEDAYVDAFNLTLGVGKTGNTFWEEVLIPTIAMKFDIHMTLLSKNTVIHKPQLSLALQHHLGVHLMDHTEYAYNHPHPVHPEDIRFVTPKIKWKLNVPSSAVYISQKSEELMAAGLFEQAFNALVLRMSLECALYGGLLDQSYRSRTAYRIAECLYALGDMEEVIRVCETEALPFIGQFTPLGGRLSSILMCAHYKLGNKDQAVLQFETAFSVYRYCLGVHHPLVMLLFSTMADLYFSDGEVHHAFVLLHLTLEMSQRALGKGHVTNGSFLLKLGTVCFMRGDSSTAKKYLEDSLVILNGYLERGLHVDDLIATCHFSLAEVLADLGELENAIEEAKKSFSMRDHQATAKGGENAEERIRTNLISSFRQLAMIYERMGNIPKAIENHELVVKKLREDMLTDTVVDMTRMSIRKIFFLVLQQQPLSIRTFIRNMSHDLISRRYEHIRDYALPYVTHQLKTEEPSLYLRAILNCVPSLGEETIDYIPDEAVVKARKSVLEKHASKHRDSEEGSEEESEGGSEEKSNEEEEGEEGSDEGVEEKKTMMGDGMSDGGDEDEDRNGHEYIAPPDHVQLAIVATLAYEQEQEEAVHSEQLKSEKGDVEMWDMDMPMPTLRNAPEEEVEDGMNDTL